MQPSSRCQGGIGTGGQSLLRLRRRRVTLARPTLTLLPSDGLPAGRVHLLVFLHDGTDWAEEVDAEVANEASVDALGFAHLATHHGASDVADEREDGKQAAQHAVLAH